MVVEQPKIVIHTINEKSKINIDYNYLWATCVEAKKGPVMSPTYIQTAVQAKQLFGIDATPFFENGGQGMLITRVATEKECKDITKQGVLTPATIELKGKYNATVGILGDDKTTVTETVKSTTPDAPLIILTGVYPGSEPITVSFSTYVKGGYSCVIEQDGYKTVRIQGARTIAALCRKINLASKTVTAKLTPEGEMFDLIVNYGAAKAVADGETVAEGQVTKIEEAPAIVPFTSQVFKGTDGDWDPQTDSIPSDVQSLAYRRGLALYTNIRMAGVFCISPEILVQNEFAMHAIEMSTDDKCRWRYALVGASPEDRVSGNLQQRSASYDNQFVLFLGQGLKYTDASTKVTTTYPPHLATLYVAGMRSKLKYGDALFGGEAKKEIKYATDLYDIYSDGDELVDWDKLSELNESGVITFKKEYDSITIREGVTTVQEGYEEDEECVMNVLKYALNQIYDVCYLYQGKNITPTLQNALEKAIEAKLEYMKAFDGTLIDVVDDTENLPAYDVKVDIATRSEQLLGKINVEIKITPTHALRQVYAQVTVQ